MNVKELIKHIEDKHWCNFTTDEEAEHRKYSGDKVADKGFNIWIPYHGWLKIKEKAGLK